MGQMKKKNQTNDKVKHKTPKTANPINQNPKPTENRGDRIQTNTGPP